jgi:hypothetical protein
LAFVAGGILAALYLLAGLLLLVGAIEVSDLAVCTDPEAVRASGEDDCIDGSSGERMLGLGLAYGSVVAAFATVLLAVIFARRRERGLQLALAAAVTPLLALGALALLPVSF